MKKIPCIICNSKLWNYIRKYLYDWNYNIDFVSSNWKDFPLLVINLDGYIGKCINLEINRSIENNREIISNVEEFLEKAAALKEKSYNSTNSIHSLIKTGMMVSLRNNEKGLIVTLFEELVIIHDNKFTPLSEYNSRLSHYKDTNLDIIKIFTIKNSKDKYKKLLSIDWKKESNYKLLWENESIIMSKKEIAEILKISENQLIIV